MLCSARLSADFGPARHGQSYVVRVGLSDERLQRAAIDSACGWSGNPVESIYRPLVYSCCLLAELASDGLSVIYSDAPSASISVVLGRACPRWGSWKAPRLATEGWQGVSSMGGTVDRTPARTRGSTAWIGTRTDPIRRACSQLDDGSLREQANESSCNPELRAVVFFRESGSQARRMFPQASARASAGVVQLLQAISHDHGGVEAPRLRPDIVVISTVSVISSGGCSGWVPSPRSCLIKRCVTAPRAQTGATSPSPPLKYLAYWPPCCRVRSRNCLRECPHVYGLRERVRPPDHN